MIAIIPEPNRAACRECLFENGHRFHAAPGSRHNHQAWPGGYLHHVTEVMNIARVLFCALDAARPLPFALSDAYLVLFLHDIEKPWKYVKDESGGAPDLSTKEKRHAFREAIIQKYGFHLTEEHENALEFVEGEIQAYSSTERLSGRLAAFCHMCDVWSARGWHDRPSPGDAWSRQPG